MKKFTALALGLMIMGVAQAAFVDETEFPSWSEEAIEVVSEANIMTGFGDGSFRPGQPLNRAEAVTLLLRAKKMEDERFNGVSKFADVPGDAWFAKAVAIAETNDWLTGKADGLFHPGDTLNRAEFAALIERAFELEPADTEPLPFDDVSEETWYAEPVKALYDRDLLRNARNKYFRPAEEITRASAAWTFAQILSKPGINGEVGENDFSGTARIDTRRVAIKPRDFNANKQSVEAEKKELKLTATPYEKPVTIIRGDEEWQLVGSVRMINTLEGSAEVTSLNVRLRFDENNVGPEDNFEARLHGPDGFERIVPASSSGESLFPGLEIALTSGDQKVYWLSYRTIADRTYFPTDGRASVILNSADGLYYEPFDGSNADRSSDVRPAPMGYEERMIGSFEFQLNE